MGGKGTADSSCAHTMRVGTSFTVPSEYFTFAQEQFQALLVLLIHANDFHLSSRPGWGGVRSGGGRQLLLAAALVAPRAARRGPGFCGAGQRQSSTESQASKAAGT